MSYPPRPPGTPQPAPRLPPPPEPPALQALVALEETLHAVRRNLAFGYSLARRTGLQPEVRALVGQADALWRRALVEAQELAARARREAEEAEAQLRAEWPPADRGERR